jgi:2-C-methyl-D-erythritol 4-phosphate cytidylyltransferase
MDGVGCVVVAAGQGTRLAAGRPKAFVELAGTTLLEHAVSRMRDAGVRHVVAVVPGELVGSSERLLTGRAVVVGGGAERQDSVALGMAALPAEVEVVLVHDAARCLAPPSLAVAVADAVRAGHRAVVPGLAVADTIKQVDDAETVVGTLERASLRAVQTPQGFGRGLLERAHAASGVGSDQPATDDAGLVERLGEPVTVVPGHRLALKITTGDDLALAELLLARLLP